MKVDKKQRDFKTRRTDIFYSCSSCCTCCLMIVGGFIGASMGLLISGSQAKATLNDPLKKAMMRTARNWFWASLLLFSPALMLLIYNVGKSKDIYELFLVGTPALNIVFASLLTTVVIMKKIPDKSIRRFIHYRMLLVSVGAIIGNFAGGQIMKMF